MRWNIVFILLFSLQVSAFQSTAQQKVTLSLKEVSIEHLFREIKRQTGLDFVYPEEQGSVWGKINVSATDEPVESVLDKILLPQGFTWKLMDGIILIKPDPAQKQQQRNRTVSGSVADKEGKPIPGATILIKGSVSGVVTDNKGHFSIHIPLEGETTLIFSFIGMKSVERKVTDDSPLRVVMQEEAVDLSDVIVTGYQQIKQEDATGSFATVRAEDLERRYSDNILESLEGKIPGMVSYNTGMNGNEKTLSIRGVNTFTNSINPLIVVDGLPVEGSIDDVNPNNIASVTVLKDAAAAAIYGARAANGVVVITTKWGRPEQTEISVSADWTINAKADYSYLNYVNGDEQIDLEVKTFDAAYADPDAEIQMLLPMVPSFMPQGYLTPVLDLYDQFHVKNSITESEFQEKINALRGHDFLKEFKKHALLNEFVQRYNLAVRGRSGKLSSNFVLNFKNSNTGIINAYSRNLNLSYRGDYALKTWLNLSFGANINMSWDKSHYNQNATNPFSVPAYTRLFDENGERNQYSNGDKAYNGSEAITNNSELKSMNFNHLDELERDFIHDKRINSRYFAHITLNILPELNLSGQFQYEDITRNISSYSEKESYTTRYLYNLYTDQKNNHLLPDGGILRKQSGKSEYYTFRVQGNYNRTFKEQHAVSAIAGLEIRETNYRLDRSLLTGYDDQLLNNQTAYTNFKAMRELTASAMFPMTGGNPGAMFDSHFGYDLNASEVTHHYVSYYANANYTYDRKYSIFGSFRKDYTDLFGTDPKFRGRPLWSVGIGWNMEKEDFMQEISFVNSLKIRGSYGFTGNIDQNTSSYMTATTTVNIYTGEQMSRLSVPPNDQLRWEKTATINLGVDYILWENRLRGSLDWYHKYSTDLLAATPLDPSEGFTKLTINNGKALNTGIEFALTGRWILPHNGKQLGWTTTLNYGYNKNEIKRVDLQPSSASELIGGHSSNGLLKGKPIRALYAYQYAGLAEKEGNERGRNILWKKADGTTTTANPNTFATDDAIYCGAIDPKHTLGVENEFTLYGFSLSGMLVFYGGHKMRADQWDDVGLNYMGYGYSGAIPKYMLDGWSPENPQSEVPGNGYYAPRLSTFTHLKYADRFIVPADFIKLRNVTLTYHFSNEICRALRIDRLNLRVQGNNLWMWKKNKLGIDPEANNPFVGGRSLKQPKSCTVSLNLTF